MIKILLPGTILSVKILKNNHTKEINIHNGVYKEKVYRSLVLADDKVFLDGEELEVLVNEYDGIVIEFVSPLDILFNEYQDPAIYLEGINAIPEGKEKEALSLIFKKYLSTEQNK